MEIPKRKDNNIMYDYEDYAGYYEPSPVDELVSEFRDKCREFILPDIKAEIERLNKENTELKAKNEEYRKREYEISKTEIDLKFKSDNLKREVEREFYQSNIGDTLKEYLETAEVWFADNRGFPQEKCSLCDDRRKLVANFSNGQTTEINCECGKSIYKYVPEFSELSLIKFNKKDSRYESDRKFYLSKSYAPSKDYSNRNDYSYNDFNLCQVANEFNDSIKELHKTKRYGTKIGFKSIEECQKYCDWLNEREAERINSTAKRKSE